MVGEIVQETYHNVAATIGVTLAFGGRERPAPAQAEKVEPVVAPPPPPPPAAPTVAMSAYPETIEQGQCSTLTWSTTGASSASIDRGVGGTDPNGSRQVCPGSTTQYTVTAMGDGGTRTASTTVTVNPPPPPPPPPPVKKAPKVIDRLVLHVNFDFDKSDVRKEDVADLRKAIDFVKKYPGYEIAIEGHTDSRGSDKYNLALSDRRAAAVKAYLLKHGMIDIHQDNIKTKGYGESNPVANNSTEKGRFENRRVEILILEK
jgi:peptidoglycan-associated lipoprotein